MKTYKKERWRTCNNCVHKQVCKNIDCEICENHIYDSSPKNYGDLTEMLSPIFKWLQYHYPNDVRLIIEHDVCTLLFEQKSFYSERIRTNEE